MESPTRGCDLGPCVEKNASSSKNTARLFLAIYKLPCGRGLARRSFAFKEPGILRLRCQTH